jgi:hypothetical protein
MSARIAARAALGSVMDDGDMRAGLVSDAGDVADEGTHVPGRVFVAAAEHA